MGIALSVAVCSSEAPLVADGCKKIVINYTESDKVEKSAALILRADLNTFSSNNNLNILVILSNSLIIKEANNNELDNDALIINLVGETDFTGSEVVVELYATNSGGEALFLGAHMEEVRFGKSKKLVKIGKEALNFSCSNLNYL